MKEELMDSLRLALQNNADTKTSNDAAITQMKSLLHHTTGIKKLK